jgi:hypothetical protein
VFGEDFGGCSVKNSGVFGEDFGVFGELVFLSHIVWRNWMA